MEGAHHTKKIIISKNHKQEKHKKGLKLQNFIKIFFFKKKNKYEIMKEWILLKNI